MGDPLPEERPAHRLPKTRKPENSILVAPIGPARAASSLRLLEVALTTWAGGEGVAAAGAMMHAHAALTVGRGHNPAAHSGRLGPALEAIRSRLRATANSDGGWGQTPGTDSDPMSTAYTLTTLAATHRHHPTVQAGLRHLLERQDGDGGYRSVSDQAAPRPLHYSVPVLTDIFVLLALTHAH